MFSSRTSKILLATFTVLCIVGVAACVAVVATASRSKNTDENVFERAVTSELPKDGTSHDRYNSNLDQDDTKHAINTSGVQLPRKSKVLRRISSRLIRKSRSADKSKSMTMGGEDTVHCESTYSNTTIPAAHIHSYGLKFFSNSTTQSSFIRKGYQQKWRCNGYLDRRGLHAYVDGGMIFNQTDKSLRVPVCGYYHITSQILFRINDTIRNPTRVYHYLKFQSNCLERDPKLSVADWSMVTQKEDRVTTHTSDVFHLCAGGKIWVEIPDGRNRNPCCPFGSEDSTFITAYLISRTSCNWPPSINQSFK